jgi:hypothetical protein
VNASQLSENHRLLVPSVTLVGIATAALPLIAMAWHRSRIMHDDFGMQISPAVQWLMNWQTPIFVVIAVLCVLAGAMLCFYARTYAATLAALVIAIGSILVETAIVIWCIIQPAAALVRELS